MCGMHILYACLEVGDRKARENRVQELMTRVEQAKVCGTGRGEG
jgi:hypothetical protein